MDVDFSFVSMFLRAHWLVQAVFVVLAVSSVGVWAVIVDRMRFYRRTKRATQHFEQAFWSGKPIEELLQRIGEHPVNGIERVFVAGMHEWRRSFKSDGAVIGGGPDRAECSMRVAIAREIERLESGLAFLATVGVSAPFIGLLGTVWGVKNSFQHIAISQNASLAVVAPGIAEALLATSLGLVAAIPAAAAYNYLLNDANRHAADLENFADEFSAILSRQFARKMER